MSNLPADTSRDWLGSKLASMPAWWFPLVAIIGGLFVPVWLRTTGWDIALGWMCTACMLNARRCNRTHCRLYRALLSRDDHARDGARYGVRHRRCAWMDF